MKTQCPACSYSGKIYPQNIVFGRDKTKRIRCPQCKNLFSEGNSGSPVIQAASRATPTQSLGTPTPPKFANTPSSIHSDSHKNSSMLNCKVHHTVAAEWWCESCQNKFCNDCIIVRPAGTARAQICKDCKGRCVPLSAEERGIPPAPFSTQIKGAFSYPFKSDKGAGLIVAGVLYWMVMGMIKFAMIVPVIGWIFVLMVGFLLAGYLSAYMIKVINRCAEGEDTPPHWPGIEGGNMSESLGLISAAGVASFLPLMGYLVFSLFLTLSEIDVGLDADLNLKADPLFWAFLVFGLFYYPMGLLTASIFRSLLAFNPVTIIGSILKVPGSYSIAFGVFVLIFIFGNASENILSLIPYLGPLISSILAFYFLMVELRILGLIYYANREKLAWF